jgi:hypothetical protein
MAVEQLFALVAYGFSAIALLLAAYSIAMYAAYGEVDKSRSPKRQPQFAARYAGSTLSAVLIVVALSALCFLLLAGIGWIITYVIGAMQ